MKNSILTISVISSLLWTTNAFAQPANDNCASATPLNANVSCINGTMTGSSLEAGEAVPTCDGSNTESVWFTYTAVSTGTATVNVTYSGMSCYAQNTAVYSGTCGSFVSLGCNTTNAFPHAVSWSATVGVTYYIQLTYSTAMGCNNEPEYCISIAQTLPAHCTNSVQDADETGIDCGGVDCPPCVVCSGTVNDDCLTEAIALTSGVTESGCTTGAANGPLVAGAPLCDMSVTSTVWYSFTTSATETAVLIDLTSTCMTAPQFSIWSSCSTVLSTTCTIGNSLTYTGLTPSTTYYIAVSDYNNGQCNFDLTATLFEDVAACLTGYTFTANASPPYAAGQTVCFTFVVTDWNKAACNWLQGFVPDWGPCWDPASFTSSAPTGGSTGGTWIWDATVYYNIAASQYNAGDNVGPGWFWMNTSDPGYATNPDAAWGNTGGCSGNACNNCANDITWQFCLTVRDSCDFGTDCMVSVKTFADGETGNWTSPGCQQDLPKFLYPYADPISCVVLPVELLDFRGHNEENYNILRWMTASETNSDSYTIEKSRDGQIFYAIGSVEAAHNTTSLTSYGYTDENPLPGINYYRLVQRDYDGEFTYSRIITIDTKTSFEITTYYPNPANDLFTVELAASEESSIVVTLTDMSGREVKNMNYNILKGDNKLQIPVSEFSQGIYYVTLYNGSDRTMKLERIKLAIK